MLLFLAVLPIVKLVGYPCISFHVSSACSFAQLSSPLRLPFDHSLALSNILISLS